MLNDYKQPKHIITIQEETESSEEEVEETKLEPVYGGIVENFKANP
jgi:hypothetical protein